VLLITHILLIQLGFQLIPNVMPALLQRSESLPCTGYLMPGSYRQVKQFQLIIKDNVQPVHAWRGGRSSERTLDGR